MIIRGLGFPVQSCGLPSYERLRAAQKLPDSVALWSQNGAKLCRLTGKLNFCAV